MTLIIPVGPRTARDVEQTLTRLPVLLLAREVDEGGTCNAHRRELHRGVRRVRIAASLARRVAACGHHRSDVLRRITWRQNVSSVRLVHNGQKCHSR